MSLTLRRQDDVQPDPGQPPAKGAAASPKKNLFTRPIGFRTASPQAAGRVEEVRFGVEPRVDLLPPEVRSARRNRRTRRGFGWAVLGVALTVALVVGGAFALDVVAQAQLAAARAHGDELLSAQREYSDVRDAQKQMGLAQAAQQAGASTEIGWKAFLDSISAVQPAGVVLTQLMVDSASPIAVYEQSEDPLQGERVGTVAIVASSPALPDVPAWAVALQKIPGVVDVMPGVVNLDEVTHSYTVTVTIHVDASLYTERFEPEEK